MAWRGRKLSHWCDGSGQIDRKPYHKGCDTRIYVDDGRGNVSPRESCECECHNSPPIGG